MPDVFAEAALVDDDLFAFTPFAVGLTKVLGILVNMGLNMSIKQFRVICGVPAIIPGALKFVRQLRYYVPAELVEIALGNLLVRVVVKVEIALECLENILADLLELCVESMESDMPLECRQTLKRIEVTLFPVTFVYWLLQICHQLNLGQMQVNMTQEIVHTIPSDPTVGPLTLETK